MKRLIPILLVAALMACSTNKRMASSAGAGGGSAAAKSKPSSGKIMLTGVATDASYGLTPENPVEVGGASNSEGPVNERKYLNMLAGPNGEKVSYYRLRSCCAVPSNNAIFGKAMLDDYRVTWEGSSDTVSIYINMYDYGELKAPVGFTIAP